MNLLLLQGTGVHCKHIKTKLISRKIEKCSQKQQQRTLIEILDMVVFTFRLQVTNKQTRRMVKTIPAAIPVTITTIELVDEDASVQSNIEVEPFTALESVTPATEKKTFMINDLGFKYSFICLQTVCTFTNVCMTSSFDDVIY